jgi:hypothetical protein
MQELSFYYRIGCHLCADMQDELAALQTSFNFSLRKIDIDDDSGLQARYSALIPVLCLGEHEICHYHLNPTALREALEAG